ncbi:hypothetical protein AQI95_04450 [Streptomyces yokosukanensis]|uniref:Uncharacterized protein n=1 Tax=Streptomyces yokosukanensis TaxID=67386 RepID=A0A101PDR0_9ACTN|nr:hypothetical protein AQI95_04450 [Streptomyces yokosukanensis]
MQGYVLPGRRHGRELAHDTAPVVQRPGEVAGLGAGARFPHPAVGEHVGAAADAGAVRVAIPGPPARLAEVTLQSWIQWKLRSLRSGNDTKLLR